ncbi:MAG TPA: electron transport complex subunit RsxC, partial [Bacillota bacterium]|nr:electron transport complex subunit RsxC [Bacillota bacterium]
MKMKWLGLPRPIHPADKKGTAGMAIKPLTGFSRVTIPLDMQVGPGCEAIVAKGDHVEIGDPLGHPIGPWSVPVHASISGTVESVQDQILSDGGHAEYVTIVSDDLNTISECVKAPVVTDRESFLEAVRASGVVGLGGAAFPTHIKLNPPPGKTIDTLIVNAAECEPYITVDNMVCVEGADDCVAGALATAHWSGIDKIVIGLEDNKKDAAQAIREAVGRARQSEFWPSGGIDIKVLKTSYPTGAEKVLIRLINGRIVPEGGLPADAGVIVQNIMTLWFIARYLRTGMPLVKKWITLDGGAVKTPGNFEVPIGSTIEDVIEKAGGLKADPSKIIMGGPMMGVAVDDIKRPILKHNNAILVLTEEEAALPEESACIQCGRCFRACPMRLMPAALDKATRANNPAELSERHVLNCIECGSCTYVCPAKRYLVQNIRNGKSLVRAAKAAAREK